MEQQRMQFDDAKPRDSHLEALLAPARPARRAGETTREIHVCAECGCGFVYPLDWAQAGARHWQVELRCPECEWRGTSVHHQDELDRFDAELDAGTAALIDDLAELTRANMAEEVDRFIAALDAGLVLPEDF